jgi:catalase
MTGFKTSSAPTGDDEQGDKLRVWAELFADHYSQARLFWKSMTDNERAHIASSLVFELSNGHARRRAAAHDRQSAQR